MAQGNNGGAPENNQNALKFATPEARKELLQAYIKHCQAGYPDEAFTLCTPKTLRWYIKNYPVDLPSDQIHSARAARMQFWFDIGMRGTVGIPMEYTAGIDPKTQQPIKKTSTKGFNAKSWQFIMMNMHKWRNRDDHTTKDKELPPGKFLIYRPEKLPANYDEMAVSTPQPNSTAAGVPNAAPGTSGNPAT